MDNIKEKLEYRYCWLQVREGLEKPVMTFTNSWDEKDHRELIDDEIMESAKRGNYKLLKFVFLNDKEFEFKEGMELIDHISVKPIVINDDDINQKALINSRNLAIALTKFVKSGGSPSECIGFIEGFEAANKC